MANALSTNVQCLWNYCNVLRDDGMPYDETVELLTYLLVLKMDDENVHVLGKPGPSIPNKAKKGCAGRVDERV